MLSEVMAYKTTSSRQAGTFINLGFSLSQKIRNVISRKIFKPKSIFFRLKYSSIYVSHRDISIISQ